MSNKYPERCPHCSADTRVRTDLWSKSMVADHGIYECGTNIRDGDDLRRGFPEDNVRGVGKHCLQQQLNSAISALEKALPVMLSIVDQSLESEDALNAVRFVVDRHNANLR